MVSVVAGGGAGVVETTLTYPLDLARTRVQMAKGSSSNSLAALLRAIVKEEGGVHRLYRGLLPPLVSEVPRRALKFTAFDTFTRGLRRLGGDGGGGSSPRFVCVFVCVIVCKMLDDSRTWYLQLGRGAGVDNHPPPPVCRAPVRS